MARPVKMGLDFFPLDVFISDEVELVEAEHGLEGFAILIKLWQKIYSSNYYIEWNEDNALLFSRKINSDVNLVNSVINSCFNRNLLDKRLHELYGILTGSGIQKRYFKIVTDAKRKGIVATKQYLLVNMELIGVNTELIELITEESTQRKEKKKKEDNNKKEEEKLLSKTFDDDSTEIGIAKYLFLNIQNINPNAKEPNYQSWAKHADYMLRIDKRSREDIKLVIDFATKDNFWQSNILSTSKLREKFDTLYIQATKPRTNYKKPEQFAGIKEWLNE